MERPRCHPAPAAVEPVDANEQSEYNGPDVLAIAGAGYTLLKIQNVLAVGDIPVASRSQKSELFPNLVSVFRYVVRNLQATI